MKIASLSERKRLGSRRMPNAANVPSTVELTITIAAILTESQNDTIHLSSAKKARYWLSDGLDGTISNLVESLNDIGITAKTGSNRNVMVPTPAMARSSLTTACWGRY